MTKKAKASNPFTLLGLGIVAVFLLGASATWLGMKPINRLGPDLDRLYHVKRILCTLRFQEATILVDPPAELVLGRIGRRRLGADAFHDYLRLTKEKTQIQQISVLGGAFDEVVTRDQHDRWAMALGLEKTLSEQASAAAGSSVTAAIAPGIDGLLVELEVTGDDAGARRAAQAILHVPDVRFVQVKRNGKVLSESGPDAKLFGGGAIAAPGSR